MAGDAVLSTVSLIHLTFQMMPAEKFKPEVDDGIASTLDALGGDSSKLAPYFRLLGLLRADGVEECPASRGIHVWSTDFPAEDRRHIPPARVYDLAIERLEAKGKASCCYMTSSHAPSQPCRGFSMS